jgi:nitrogen regulatory protein PII
MSGYFSREGIEFTMELLVVVLGQEDKLDPILAGFVEIGITGATVIESRGMARQLSEDATAAPVFAGLQELLARARPQSKTIFSVVETQAKLDAAIEMIQKVCGDMTNPGTGIVFTMPVNRVVGLAPELASESR